MAKTVSMRLDDTTYNLIINAATWERRSISNFIEYATMAYLAEESFIADDEMDEILSDKDLLLNLKKGNDEIESGKYRIIG